MKSNRFFSSAQGTAINLLHSETPSCCKLSSIELSIATMTYSSSFILPISWNEWNSSMLWNSNSKLSKLFCYKITWRSPKTVINFMRAIFSPIKTKTLVLSMVLRTISFSNSLWLEAKSGNISVWLMLKLCLGASS